MEMKNGKIALDATILIFVIFKMKFTDLPKKRAEMCVKFHICFLKKYYCFLYVHYSLVRVVAGGGPHEVDPLLAQEGVVRGRKPLNNAARNGRRMLLCDIAALFPRLSSRDDSPSKSGGKGGSEGERRKADADINPGQKRKFSSSSPSFSIFLASIALNPSPIKGEKQREVGERTKKIEKGMFI